jgi:hypothetical protein
LRWLSPAVVCRNRIQEAPTSGELPFREQLVEIGSQRNPVLSRKRYHYSISHFLAEKNGLKPESFIPQKSTFFSSMI